jgi:uncharacterized delta-60 repeat protein
VVTWGSGDTGGDSTAVQDQLTGVTQVFSTSEAFAALKANGSMVTWGAGYGGGDSTAVHDQLTGVTRVFSNMNAFAALKADGTVVTWGSPSGGDSSAVQDQLTGVTQVFSTSFNFAALKSDGTVVTWGIGDTGGDSTAVQDQLTSVTQVFSNSMSFAALRADGTVVTWGQDSLGGDSSAVQDQLTGVTRIFSTMNAFAALKDDGTVVTWGFGYWGGDSSAVQDQLTGVVGINTVLLDDDWLVNSAPSFDSSSAMAPGDGKAIISLGAGNHTAAVVFQQDDGKLVLAGHTGSEFVLVRLDADGDMDPHFGTGGHQTIFPEYDNFNGRVIQQANGQLVVYGGLTDGDVQKSIVARFNADGSQDSSFGEGGRFIWASGYSSGSLMSVGEQTNGQLVLAGSFFNGTAYEYSAIRLDTNGNVDLSFGENGQLTLNELGQSIGQVFIQDDGQIWVYRNRDNGSYGEYSVIQFTADGALDTSFGQEGQIDIPYGDYWRYLARQSDGKFYVYSVNNNGDQHGILRLNADGSLDVTYGEDGLAVLPGTAYWVGSILQADGKLVMAGSDNSGGTELDFAIVRLNADGSPDTDFGEQGKAVFSIGRNDHAISLIQQEDGKLVLSGMSLDSNYGFDFAILRLNTDGSLDTAFNNGTSTLDGVASFTEGGAAVVLDESVAIHDANLAALQGGAGDYGGASVTLARVGGAVAEDVFSGSTDLVLSANTATLSGVHIGTVSQSNGGFTLIFAAGTTQAQVNEAMSSLAYRNTSGAPPEGVQIVWTFSDGNNGQQGAGGTGNASGTTTVNITAVDGEPVAPVDPVGASVTTLRAAAASTVSEADGTAISTFTLDDALDADAVVVLNRSGWSASAEDDLTGPMQWRTGDGSTFGAWADVPANGQVTITAGHTQLQVRSTLVDDALVEADEVFVVVAAQVSDNLSHSYYVPHKVTIADNDTAPAPLVKSSIVASTPAEALAVTEGQAAVAHYSLTAPLAADAKVTINAPGWYATAGEDYDLATLQYQTQNSSGNWSDWTFVADGSDITLIAGTVGLNLKVDTLADEVTENPETLSFVVRQTAWDGPLENSGWVSQSITITDVPVAVSNPGGALVTALKAAPATSISETAGTVISTFTLDEALASDAVVELARFGFSASLTADLTGPMQWRTGDGTTFGEWADVAADGQVTIAGGHTQLQVRSTVADDDLVEANESFAVVATQVSHNLRDSYWVSHQATIIDNDTPAAPLVRSTIQVSTPAQAGSVNEGQAAIASYSLTAPLAAAAAVNVSAPGWNAAAGEDYDLSSLQYRTQLSGAAWSDWVSVADGSNVTLAAGTVGLELKVDTLNDGVTESPEGLSFVVRQIAWDGPLEKSGWVSQSITITDAVDNGEPPALSVLMAQGYRSDVGYELFKVNLSDNAVEVIDIRPGTGSSNPTHVTALGNGTVVFNADNGTQGKELWVSDGLSASLLKDIRPGTASGDPVNITALGNGAAVFSANAAGTGRELWVTDGTAGGTQLLMDIKSGTSGSAPTHLTALGNGTVVFSVDDGVTGRELWATDGTVEGTGLVKNINEGAGMSSSPKDIVALGNGKAVFNASGDLGSGSELWITDGTAEGTVMLKEMVAGTGNGNPLDMTALGNGKVVFSANAAGKGRELWVTDGTEAGTQLLVDLVPGGTGSRPDQITYMGNGVAVFRALDVTGVGLDLWSTDGTIAGTQLIGDWNSDFDIKGSVLGGDAWITNHLGQDYLSDGTTAGFVELDGSETLVLVGNSTNSHLFSDVI